LDGEAQLMPWNSSKTGINYSHPLFHSIRPVMLQLVTQYSSLSRRLKGNWGEKVFKYEKGKIQKIDERSATSGKKLILPPLPRVNKPHVESLKERNKKQLSDQPWTLGLVEAVAAVNILTKQKLETKNRVALLLLDSNFEIALKEFIVHRLDLFPKKDYTNEKIRNIFQRRNNVINEVKKKVDIPDTYLDKANHYYGLRNKLIHERATVEVTDSDIKNYSETIRSVLKILFDLNL